MGSTDTDLRVSALLSEIEKLIDGDKPIPIIVPFLATILSSIGFIVQIIILQLNAPFDNIVEVKESSTDLSYIGLSFLIASLIAVIYAVYRWVNARNKHFARSSRLYSLIIEIVEILNFEKASILKSRLNELVIHNSNKKSVAINAILSAIIPFYILYVYHFMNKDFVNHSRKEKLLLAELLDDIKKRDVQFVRSIIEYEEVEAKNTVIYIILSIITLGVFTLYWAYAITRDYNEHLNTHKLIDNDIINALKRINQM